MESQPQTKKTTLATSLGSNPTIEKNIPDDVVWIDDVFYVKKTMFGLYTSVLREPLGANFLTGATEEGVSTMTRWHLKCLQDGTLDDYTYVTGASMGVKL
jgi:hypothetical protein